MPTVREIEAAGYRSLRSLRFRLPPFLALNEASLHPDLMEPLERMSVGASKRSQVWLVTHSERAR